ncbi:unnamed protein product [Prunus armeniaca]|uniref:Uncharacterized protein n=1 Tax=Prunus armeniaca TaxID=36596 RepID=A0A6J5XCJ3_PRUAR|nr:unnamed protein product [Prunus armeniaca]CAB4311646.1 unnamed protein product [Prunus armeniaca]
MDEKYNAAGMADTLEGWWSLCFDRFDMTLPEWLNKVANKEITDADKVNLYVGRANMVVGSTMVL